MNLTPTSLVLHKNLVAPNCQAFKEKMQANPDMVFDLVMGKEV